MEESAMKKTATKAAFSIVLVITLLMSFSLPAFAYSLKPYRHKSSKIYYYYDNWVGSRAISFFSTGASAWSARTTEAQILHYSNNPEKDTMYICVQETLLGLSGTDSLKQGIILNLHTMWYRKH